MYGYADDSLPNECNPDLPKTKKDQRNRKQSTFHFVVNKQPKFLVHNTVNNQIIEYIINRFYYLSMWSEVFNYKVRFLNCLVF